MLQLTQDNNLKEALFSSTYLYENLIKSTSHVEADTGSHREFFLLQERLIYIYYLPAGRSVLRKTVPEVLSTARGRRPRAVLKTEGTVFLNTDRPRPANNIFIFFLLFFKS